MFGFAALLELAGGLFGPSYGCARFGEQRLDLWALGRCGWHLVALVDADGRRLAHAYRATAPPETVAEVVADLAANVGACAVYDPPRGFRLEPLTAGVAPT